MGGRAGAVLAVVTAPSHRGASEVFRRSTECASVPREGRTFQFDARTGWGGSYTQLVAVKVVAIAVRMVITMLRTLPQVELLLNVPIVFRLKVKG